MAPFALSVGSIPGLAAGALVILIGLFVLSGGRSALHVAFFGLALADGGSTILFVLSQDAADPVLALALRGAYGHAYILFLGLLLGFGLLFPTTLGGHRLRAPLMSAIGILTLALLVTFVLARDQFWTAQLNAAGALDLSLGPGRRALSVLLVLAVGLICVRLAAVPPRAELPVTTKRSRLVLAGLLLGFGTSVVANFARLLFHDRALLLAPPTIVHALLFAAGGAFVLVVAWTAVRAFGDIREQRAPGARAVAASAGSVLVLGAALAFTPSLLPHVENVALLLYPALLAYAIVRYEAFGLDARLRRTAAFTLAAGGGAVLFISAENALQDALSDRLFAGLPLASLLAGLLAAVLVVPLTNLARRLLARVLPHPGPSPGRERRLEVYRASLEAALLDGRLEGAEARALTALRASLGISTEDHARLVAEIRGPVA